MADDNQDWRRLLDHVGHLLGYHDPSRCALRGRPHDGDCTPPAGPPDLIVIRPAAGLPDGWLPPSEDGRWYDRASMPQAPRVNIGRPDQGVMQARAAGRFEVRAYDGAVAEVWEIGP